MVAESEAEETPKRLTLREKMLEGQRRSSALINEELPEAVRLEDERKQQEADALSKKLREEEERERILADVTGSGKKSNRRFNELKSMDQHEADEVSALHFRDQKHSAQNRMVRRTTVNSGLFWVFLFVLSPLSASCDRSVPIPYTLPI